MKTLYFLIILILVIAISYAIDKNVYGCTGFCAARTSSESDLSPLKQFKSGTPANDVKCNDGLQLVIKVEDNSPACVISNTASILIERGWAQDLLTTNGLKDIYAPGEKIGFTIDFKGLVHDSCSQPDITILDSNRSVVWQSKEGTQLCISSPFAAYYVDRTFNLLSDLGGPIVINQTGNYNVKISWYDQSLEKHFSVNSRND